MATMAHARIALVRSNSVVGSLILTVVLIYFFSKKVEFSKGPIHGLKMLFFPWRNSPYWARAS
jgi:hypothetical protein